MSEDSNVASLKAFRDLEPKLRDLVRLAEMALDLNLAVIDDSDSKAASHAILLAEILLERAEQLKVDFYAAYGAGGE